MPLVHWGSVGVFGPSRKQISPGPPDYESVTSGDEPITRWYLQLPWPVCFDEYRHVTKLQLALEPQEVAGIDNSLAKKS